MYLRKSSEAEDRQQLSIPAQERALRELAGRQKLVVVGEPIAEAMSAKQPGRPGFAALLERTRRGEADGILCWHLDRLARNPLDGGTLMWSLGQKEIKSIVTPDRTYLGTGDDKLLMSIVFGIATKYSDDLSANVRRGQREAVLRGNWPNRPKTGYVRAKDGSIVPDPECWDLLCELWRMRVEGRSIREILERAHNAGFRKPTYGRQGNRCFSVSEVYRFFGDPFYTGRMPFSGEIYQGTHRPMVSEHDFDAVQRFGRGHPVAAPEPDSPFYYRKMIRCGACGSGTTAEVTVNRHGSRYIYYHCARKDRRRAFCPQRSIEARTLDAQLAEFFGTLTLPKDIIELVLEEFEHAAAQAKTWCATEVERLRKEVARLDNMLANLRRMRAADEISSDDFAADQQRYQAERNAAFGRLDAASTEDNIEPWRAGVSLLSEAKDRFLAANGTQKRELVLAATSNLTLIDGKLLVVAKEPFRSLAQLGEFPTLRSITDDVRTEIAHYLSVKLCK